MFLHKVHEFSCVHFPFGVIFHHQVVGDLILLTPLCIETILIIILMMNFPIAFWIICFFLVADVTTKVDEMTGYILIELSVHFQIYKDGFNFHFFCFKL